MAKKIDIKPRVDFTDIDKLKKKLQEIEDAIGALNKTTIKIDGIDRAYVDLDDLRSLIEKTGDMITTLNENPLSVGPDVSLLDQQNEALQRLSDTLQTTAQLNENFTAFEPQTHAIDEETAARNRLNDTLEEAERQVTMFEQAQVQADIRVRERTASIQREAEVQMAAVNSLDRMRAQLAALQAEWSSIDISSGRFRELSGEIETLNQRIADAEVQSGTLDERLSVLKKRLADMIAEGVDPSSDAFVNLRRQAANLERAVNEAGETVELFASRTQSLDQIVGVGNSIKSSFESAQGVLKLFGKESDFLNEVVQRLEGGMKALTGVQSVYNQMTKKGTIENKLYSGALNLIAKAQAFVAASTSISNKALRMFKVALASTGIGLLIVALGTLVANFDKIKAAIKKAVPEIDNLGEGFDKVQDVVRGFGNVVLQYVLTPLRTVAAVVRKLMERDFKGAFDVGIEEVKKGLNVIENFQDGYNERSVNKAKEAFQQILEVHNGVMEQIRENEAKTEDSGTDFGGSGGGVDSQKDKLKEYRDAYESFQSETYSLQVENDQKKIDAAKEAAEEMQAVTREELDKRNAAIGEAYEEQLKLNKQIHEDEKKAVEKKYEELVQAARKAGQSEVDIVTARKTRLDELQRRMEQDELALVKEKNSKIKDSNDRFNEESADSRKKALDEEMSLLEKHYEEVEEAMEDMVVRHRDGEGFIDVAKTKENYRQAGESLERYLEQVTASKERMREYYDNLLEMYKDDAENFIRIQKEKEEALKRYEKKEKETHEKTKKNTKDSEKVISESLQEIVDGVNKYTEAVMSAINSVFDTIGMDLEYRLEEAQEKLDAISEKHDEMVEKVEDSNDRIKSLQEEAKSAQGGRLAVIQEQIAREMESRQELANKEKELAKEKEKAEKEKEKLERQQKKNEMKQQIIQGVANIALGVAKALGAAPPPFNYALAAIVGAMGAVQVGIMTKQLSKMADGGLLNGKRHSAGGMRIEGTSIEVEGGEYVINRMSTQRNLGLVRYINSQRRELSAEDVNGYFASSGVHGRMPAFRTMFAEGGQLPAEDAMDTYGDNAVLRAIESINFQPVVSVVDIANVQQSMTQVTEWTNTR